MAIDSRRDADKLGPVKADPTDPEWPGADLVTVDDVVSFIVASRHEPRRPAAKRVLDKLAADSGPVAVFLTRPDDYAERLANGYEWRPTVEPREVGMQTTVTRRPAFSVTAWGGNDSQFREQRKTITARPAVPGLYGVPGAWQVLRDAWCGESEKVQRAAVARHGGQIARLAIPVDLAASMFGYPASGAVQARPLAPVMHLVKPEPAPRAEGAPADGCAQHANESPATAAPPAWKDEHGQWLPATLDAWRKLRDEGVSDPKIAKQYGVTRGVITGKLGTKTANKVASQGHKVSSKAAW